MVTYLQSHTAPILMIRSTLIFALGVLNFIFANSQFFSAKFVLAELFVQSGPKKIYFCVFFLVFGLLFRGVLFALVLLKWTWGTLDSGIAVHASTSTRMWISWTWGLQSVAQQTNNQAYRMIHVFLNTSLSTRT